MKTADNVKKHFTTQLLAWHHNDNDRDLPWKSEQDPYKIWLSEIILQQTRALQGKPYYLRFIEAYPTISDMAAAADDDVFRIWQGLGYYNRCRNMLATARYVANELNGAFPATYDGIIALKGIGPYTAAAIASFAYGLPHAVVDGNVYRVLSRYFGIDTPIDSTQGKNLFTALAEQLLDNKNSAAYNQAIMDLGATVCTPRNPLCPSCPLSKHCMAHKQQMTDLLPVKNKKIKVATRYFHYLLLHWDDKLWIHKRDDNDIWAGLHEPLLIEHTSQLTLQDIQQHPAFTSLGKTVTSITPTGKLTQRLTHRIVQSAFFTVSLKNEPTVMPADGAWVPVADLGKIAFPKTLVSFLKNNLYF